MNPQTKTIVNAIAETTCNATDPNDRDAALEMLSTRELKTLLKKAGILIPKNKIDMITRLSNEPKVEIKISVAADVVLG